jgi:multiple sugar transport system permease protein
MATFITAGNTALYQMVAAGVIFSILPVTLFMVVQRHIARGLTAGALK